MASADEWKYPKIPVCNVYYESPKKSFFRNVFPGYVVKDFEQTITLSSNDNFKTLDLLDKKFPKRCIKNKYEFIHLGLVQVTVKPLSEEGVDASVIVGIRDDRVIKLKNSIVALVQANLSNGPFYFNHYPGHPVYAFDPCSPLTLFVKTTGVPMAVTVRVVCKAMVRDMLHCPNYYYKEPFIKGYTSYVNAVSGSQATTEWDEVFRSFRMRTN